MGPDPSHNSGLVCCPEAQPGPALVDGEHDAGVQGLVCSVHVAKPKHKGPIVVLNIVHKAQWLPSSNKTCVENVLTQENVRYLTQNEISCGMV